MRRIVLSVISLLMLGACTVKSIDSSTEEGYRMCETIKNEQVRADCIVRVAQADPDR